jgi:putative hemolysin
MAHEQSPALIDAGDLLRGPLRNSPIGRPLSALMGRLLGVDELNRLYARVADNPPGLEFYEAILRELQVTVRVTENDVKRIPPSGPLVVVANHPFGALEGIVLAWLLLRIRPDVRVMANFLLQRMPQLKETTIAVDPFGGPVVRARNLQGLRSAVEWIRRGGALGVFPAGEVSHWDTSQRCITDPPWNPNIARLIRQTGACAVPMYFEGSNDLAFQVSGLLNPLLRTAQLGKQLLNKRNRTVEVRVGTALESTRLNLAESDEAACALLRKRVYLLAHRGRSGVASTLRRLTATMPLTAAKPVVAPLPKDAIAAAVDRLPAHFRLLDQGDFSVYCVPGSGSPELLREIGRLREITFRAAGEGTGKPIDLDRFDPHYRHLFVYHQKEQEVVGAYRIADIQEVLSKQGLEGLYLNTLFHFQPEFFPKLGNALELGRSFVRQEYQRSSAALMLLWKGIGKVVLQTPSCFRLLGPVSISNEYSDSSRRILVDALARHAARSRSTVCPLGSLVRPRRPFAGRALSGWDQNSLADLLRDVDALSSLVSELESDGKGIPVLLRQYLRLGGQVLAFNVDPQFANTLDGLIVLDLRETDPRTLAKYLGKDGALAMSQPAGATPPIEAMQ